MAKIKELFSKLAQEQNRAVVHAIFLIACAAGVLFFEMNFQLLSDIQSLPPDKIQHYQYGRWIAAGLFLMAYMIVIGRVLLWNRRSIVRSLLWIPTLMGVGFLLTLAVVFFIGAGKEVGDMGGAGNPEMEDMHYTIEGALTMTVPIALIMALTPLLIPFDMLLQIPGRLSADKRTGNESVDDYVEVAQTQRGTLFNVLLLEDDIACATAVLSFCRMFKLTCFHASSITEADEFFSINGTNLDLMVLDNFVRVDEGCRFKTGAEWFNHIEKKHRKINRTFKVVFATGHTDFLGAAAGKADLVLQKPWEPTVLLTFLRENGIIT